MNRYKPTIFLVLPLVYAIAASADTIGIRFIVSEDLGQPPEQQQTTKATLENYVDGLNDRYRNSEVALNAQIVQIEFTRINAVEDVDIIDDMAHQQNGFTSLFQKADEFGADYTVAIPSKLNVLGNPGCGRAVAVNQSIAAISSTRNAFAVINFVCGAHTLAHELGHLMGLNHGTLVDICHPNKGHTSAITRYANGYAEGNCDGKPQEGEFSDIMVGGHMRDIVGNDKANLAIFSNPRLHDKRCGLKQICGDPVIGDAVRALNENARYFSMHEEPDVHVLTYRDEKLLACIGEKYRGKEIVDLEELTCPNAGIAELSGIEQLTGLHRIDLSGNDLEDLTPFEKLSPDHIERIDLTGNERVSCSSLHGLEGKFPGKVVHPKHCASGI